MSFKTSDFAIFSGVFVALLALAHPAFAQSDDEASSTSASASASASSSSCPSCCDPQRGNSGTSCIGLPCAQFGQSELDGNKSNIVACLYTNGTSTPLVWKNQTPAPASNTVSFTHNGHTYTVPASFQCQAAGNNPLLISFTGFLGSIGYSSVLPGGD